MLEQLVSGLARRGKFLDRSGLFRSLMNSEFGYWILERYVSGYIELLREPTNRNVLAAIKKADGVAAAFMPDGKDRVFESGILGAIKRNFEAAEETGVDTNFTLKTKRLLELMGGKYIRTFFLDFMALRFGVGNLNDHHLGRKGEPFFHYLVVQPNSDCNTNSSCRLTCFALKSRGKLGYETLDRVVGESIELGARFTIVVGGEPLLEKETLLQLFGKYRKMPFLLATNGILVDDEFSAEVSELGNVMTVINTPGLEAMTNQLRKNPKVWKDIVNAATTLRKHGAAVGFASTVYSVNYEQLSSPEFAKQMIDLGMFMGLYFEYNNPVGTLGHKPIKGLGLTSGMRDDFSRRVQEVSGTYPLILVNTIGGENKIGGCPAARAGMVYVQRDGNVGGCPIVPQLSDRLNVHNGPLKKILNETYFKLLREERPVCLKSNNFPVRLQKAVDVVIPQ